MRGVDDKEDLDIGENVGDGKGVNNLEGSWLLAEEIQAQTMLVVSTIEVIETIGAL